MAATGDGLDDLREENLRDPLAHANALFQIEASAQQISDAVARIASSSEEQVEAFKERHQDLSDYLVQYGPQRYLPEISTSLRHIKILLIIVVLLMCLLLLQ
jgi:hypothetical protein